MQPENRELPDRKTRTTSMRPYILFAVACLWSYPAIAQTQNQPSDNKTAANRPPWPLQLEMRVPFEPTAFPSGPHVYLMYELHLTNFMPMPISLNRIEVFDADAGTSQPIATFEAGQLETMLQPLGGRALSAPKDRLENIPGHGDAFHPAVPITLETVAGNTITLDLGGQFAYYMHLQPGSLRVKAGDRVQRGQVLARVGASGDAREPHLHFEVTTSSKILAGGVCPMSLSGTAARPRVTGLRNSTHTTCRWIKASSYSRISPFNDETGTHCFDCWGCLSRHNPRFEYKYQSVIY